MNKIINERLEQKNSVLNVKNSILYNRCVKFTIYRVKYTHCTHERNKQIIGEYKIEWSTIYASYTCYFAICKYYNELAYQNGIKITLFKEIQNSI